MKYLFQLLFLVQFQFNFTNYGQQVDSYPSMNECFNLLERGKADSAIKKLLSIIEINPGNGLAYSYLGIAYNQKGELHKAVEAFKKALDSLPDDKDILGNLGNTYTDLEMFDEAIAVLKRATEIYTNDANTFIDLGVVYERMDNNDEAIRLFQKAVSLDPNNPLGRYNLGYSYYKINKWTEAIDELMIARSIDEWYPRVEECLMSTLKASFADLKKWEEDKPNDPMAHYYYSLALLYEGDIELAEDEIEEAIKQDGTKGIFYYAKAFIYCNDSKNDIAISASNQCIMRDPSCWACSVLLGQLYLESNEFKKALNILERAARINSNVISIYCNLGAAYSQLGKYREAVGVFSRAINLGSKSSRTYFNLGVIYYKLKNYEMAWFFVRKAERLGYNNTRTLIEELSKVSKEPD